ncbi:PapD-like protein [Vararia minispora EC-137]|uniref:PapD-like protein n=1 Tax=Vararia minispora EC-137 TaxID=1314806 RepID=A0ACB8QX59_9AGAM|nr:PapD-like protein [Vararia minispora EC-137]
MSVQLNPSSVLGFHRPLTQNVKRALSITNNNAQPVAFKVKTTAPKLYCVRPNSGRVEPGETVEVQVMLQAMKEEPPLNTKCKDKFLIQSTLLTPEKSGLDVWSLPETDEVSKIHSQRIKVTYLPPEGVVEEEDEGVQHRASIMSADDAPQQRYATVKTQPAQSTIAHEPAIRIEREATPPADFAVAREEPHEEPRHEDKQHSGVGVVNVNVHQPPSVPSPPVPVPAPLHVPPPVDPNPELEAKLDDAQAEIQRLRALLAAVPDPSSVVSSDPSGTSPTELRRRYRPRSDDGTTEVVSDTGSTYISEAYAQPEGVPLQVVVIIALIVFVTTYVFF